MLFFYEIDSLDNLLWWQTIHVGFIIYLYRWRERAKHNITKKHFIHNPIIPYILHTPHISNIQKIIQSLQQSHPKNIFTPNILWWIYYIGTGRDVSTNTNMNALIHIIPSHLQHTTTSLYFVPVCLLGWLHIDEKKVSGTQIETDFANHLT